MERKAFVLLSGGLDSTTCLFKAIYDYRPAKHDMVSLSTKIAAKIDHTTTSSPLPPIDWVEAVSIDYGQRHKKETEYARIMCDTLGIEHTILDVGKLLSGATVMLTNESKGNVEVPNMSYNDIKGVSPTYVPFRNGLMLSALTAHAQKWVNEQIDEGAFEITRELAESPTSEESQRAKETATKAARDIAGIYFGAHAEDAHNWAYPDCTPEFIGSMANAIYTGSYYAIRLHTPLEWLSKAEIIKLGTSLDVPYDGTWSCYKGEELHCGTCPTCRARKEGFIAAGVADPTTYAA